MDPVPTDLEPRSRHTIARICMHVGGLFLQAGLVDSGSKIDTITLDLLEEIQRKGHRVRIKPFLQPRYTSGIASQEPLLGSIDLMISPGRNYRALQLVTFSVMKRCPQPIILGTPTIDKFKMDLLSSQDTVQFFYKTRTANGFTVSMDTTSMQIVESTNTFWYSNASPFVKVYTTETVTIEPNEGVRVS
ncbi:hypothetical protein HDU76_011889, partial [Blyttiomyces sp. JEL0837]